MTNEILSEQGLIDLVKNTCAEWAREEMRLNADHDSNITFEQRYSEHLSSFINVLGEL